MKKKTKKTRKTRKARRPKKATSTMARRRRTRRTSPRRRTRLAHNPRRHHGGRTTRVRRRRRNDSIWSTLAIAGVSALGAFIAMDTIEAKQLLPKSVTDSPLVHASVLSGIGMLGGAALYKYSPAAGLGAAGGVMGLAGFIGMQAINAAKPASTQPTLSVNATGPVTQPASGSAQLATMGAIRARRLPHIGAIERAYDMANVGRIVYSDFRRAA